jgi:hypothetical protein
MTELRLAVSFTVSWQFSAQSAITAVYVSVSQVQKL